jgi:hypothetical protein
MAEKQLDVLAVGDVVTDAFIRLLPDQEKVEYGKDGQPDLSIPFGTKKAITTTFCGTKTSAQF